MFTKYTHTVILSHEFVDVVRCAHFSFLGICFDLSILYGKMV
jgi:hypothetical protein